MHGWKGRKQPSCTLSNLSKCKQESLTLSKYTLVSIKRKERDTSKNLVVIELYF